MLESRPLVKSSHAIQLPAPNVCGVRLFNQGDSQIHFGWVRLDLPAGGTTPGTLIDFAWESQANTPIGALAGVPEPSSLAVIGLVGGAPVARRRRSA